MATQAQWKQPDGAGGFDVIHHETSAEMVTYNGGTVKDYLDNAASTSISAQVRGLLSAEDAEAARQVLNVSPDPFFDESGNRWHYPAGVALSDEYAKFGTTSLRLSGSSTYLRRIKEVTLGGADFTISCWAYATKKSTSAEGFFSWGTQTENLMAYRNGSDYISMLTTHSNSAVGSTTSTEFALNQWNHVEISYQQSSNNLRLFFNGNLIDTRQDTNFNTARTFPFYVGYNVRGLKYLTGYIDELLITEKLLHDADFQSDLPTSYSADEDTIALLNFE